MCLIIIGGMAMKIVELKEANAKLSFEAFYYKRSAMEIENQFYEYQYRINSGMSDTISDALWEMYRDSSASAQMMEGANNK